MRGNVLLYLSAHLQNFYVVWLFQIMGETQSFQHDFCEPPKTNDLGLMNQIQPKSTIFITSIEYHNIVHNTFLIIYAKSQNVASNSQVQSNIKILGKFENLVNAGTNTYYTDISTTGSTRSSGFRETFRLRGKVIIILNFIWASFVEKM